MAKHSALRVSFSPILTGSRLLPTGSKSRACVVCEINAALLLHSDCLRPKMAWASTPGKMVGKLCSWLFIALGYTRYFMCCMNPSALWGQSNLPLDQVQDFPVDLPPSHIQVLPALSFHPVPLSPVCDVSLSPWIMTWTKQPWQSMKTRPGKLPITLKVVSSHLRTLSSTSLLRSELLLLSEVFSIDIRYSSRQLHHCPSLPDQSKAVC